MILVPPGPGLPVAGPLVPVSVTVMPVTAVSKEMHHRAGQQQQVRQDSEHVGTVLGEQKNPAIARKPINTSFHLEFGGSPPWPSS